MRGLFIGDDIECFNLAAELSLKVNFEMLDEPISKAVVYLDPQEFHSTWIGNKAIYRTRMALDDGAELIILAPGVKEFGEDKSIDGLIRKYGYRGTAATLQGSRGSCGSGQRSERGGASHSSARPKGASRLPGAPANSARKKWKVLVSATAICPQCLRATIPKNSTTATIRSWAKPVFFIANPGLGLWARRGRL